MLTWEKFDVLEFWDDAFEGVDELNQKQCNQLDSQFLDPLEVEVTKAVKNYEKSWCLWDVHPFYHEPRGGLR